jgi:hypothetical protein
MLPAIVHLLRTAAPRRQGSRPTNSAKRSNTGAPPDTRLMSRMRVSVPGLALDTDSISIVIQVFCPSEESRLRCIPASILRGGDKRGHTDRRSRRHGQGIICRTSVSPQFRRVFGLFAPERKDCGAGGGAHGVLSSEAVLTRHFTGCWMITDSVDRHGSRRRRWFCFCFWTCFRVEIGLVLDPGG